MKRVLVTGGSGFIGTNLIDFLKSKGNLEIFNLDIVEPKNIDHNRFWLKADIRDRERIRGVFEEVNPNLVIHLAARTDLAGKTIKDYDSNTLGVENLVSVINQVSSVKLALFASSMYVCRPGYHPADMDDYAPHTVYGESKVLTEKIIKEAGLKIPWVIFRPTSIWGPWFGEPYIDFFNIVLSRKYFHLGRRACRKTYGYIGNTVRQIEALMNADVTDINKEGFYLGDWPAYNISEWAEEIAENKSIRIPQIPYFLFQIAGLFGDFLKLFRVKFPMTSFRLRNMTTDNVHDLSPIQRLMPNLPYSRKEGTDATLAWMHSEGKI